MEGLRISDMGWGFWSEMPWGAEGRFKMITTPTYIPKAHAIGIKWIAKEKNCHGWDINTEEAGWWLWRT